MGGTWEDMDDEGHGDYLEGAMTSRISYVSIYAAGVRTFLGSFIPGSGRRVFHVAFEELPVRTVIVWLAHLYEGLVPTRLVP